MHTAPIMRRAAQGASTKKGRKGKIQVQVTRDANDVMPHIAHDGRAKLATAKGKLDQVVGNAQSEAKT